MYRLIEADHYINKKILVIGGGDSAVEAAMGLASQSGNQVTLSYRSEQFSRIKERNAKRIEEFAYVRAKSSALSIRVPWNSSQSRSSSMSLDKVQEIPERFRLDLRRGHAAQWIPQENRRRLWSA